MSAVAESLPLPKAETPFRRLAREFFSNRIATAAFAAPAHHLPRAVRAAHRAAEPLRPLQGHRARRAPRARRARLGRFRDVARRRRRRARHVERDALRPAHQPRRRRRLGRDRARDRHRDRPARGLPRRLARRAHHAARRPAALLPRDPGRADPGRDPRPRRRQGDDRADPRAVGLLRAHRARLGAGRAAQGVHRGGALPRAAGAAHRVPPPAAERGGADDRGRHAADRARDLARGDALVPRRRPAAHRALARAPDRERLRVHALGQVLDQLLPASRCSPRS